MLSKAPPGARKRLAEREKAKAFGRSEYQTLVESIWAPFNTRFLNGTPADLKATKLSNDVYRAMLTRTGNEFVVDGTLARWDGRKYYAKIEVPTLVLVGRYDFFLEPAKEMSARIVPAHMRVMPRAPLLSKAKRLPGKYSVTVWLSRWAPRAWPTVLKVEPAAIGPEDEEVTSRLFWAHSECRGKSAT
jgi:pimeloyl-ACP methyl ester carboxylesterase